MKTPSRPPGGQSPGQSESGHEEQWLELAHNIRNPLNAAKGAIYYLKNAHNLADEEKNAFINILASEIDRLATVLEKELSNLPNLFASSLGQQADQMSRKRGEGKW